MKLYNPILCIKFCRLEKARAKIHTLQNQWQIYEEEYRQLLETTTATPPSTPDKISSSSPPHALLSDEIYLNGLVERKNQLKLQMKELLSFLAKLQVPPKIPSLKPARIEEGQSPKMDDPNNKILKSSSFLNYLKVQYKGIETTSFDWITLKDEKIMFNMATGDYYSKECIAYKFWKYLMAIFT